MTGTDGPFNYRNALNCNVTASIVGTRADLVRNGKNIGPR